MSTRAHFWFRIAAITAIILAQFGPRLWNGATGSSPAGAVASQVITAGVP
jgi:hypothetical protein